MDLTQGKTKEPLYIFSLETEHILLVLLYFLTSSASCWSLSAHVLHSENRSYPTI